MKKIRSLQILVYIAFALLILQSGATEEAWQGFKEGATDTTFPGGKTLISTPSLHAVIDGSFVTHTAATDLKVDDSYLLQNISLYSDVQVNPDHIKSPVILTGLNIALMLVALLVLILIAYNINKVIKSIAEGSMFDWACIKLIRRIATLLLFYALMDFAYQQIDYYRQVQMIHAPLRVINTSSFNFVTLITAILVFIIAEAFKQGIRLKEEQAYII